MSAEARDRAVVLGSEIDRVRMSEAVMRCQIAIEEGGFLQHMSLNAAKIVSLRADPQLQAIVAGSELVTADGQAVVWASRLLRDPLPERVAGIDLMNELFGLAERSGYGVYLLGATEETLGRATERLLARHPDLRIAGSHHGYFADEDSPAICAQIKASRPDLLFVAMSSPRKEYWLKQYGRGLGIPVIMGVGGALDVTAGDVRRAPRAVQALGLEWAYRLAQEPRRLWRRYLVTNTRFIALVARQRFGRHRPGSSPADLLAPDQSPQKAPICTIENEQEDARDVADQDKQGEQDRPRVAEVAPAKKERKSSDHDERAHRL
jgi:N-acetylglucosaminyldiphosphoundecaprenol N-acetyl-beta-D-mannosaminyltransferase